MLILVGKDQSWSRKSHTNVVLALRPVLDLISSGSLRSCGWCGYVVAASQQES